METATLEKCPFCSRYNLKGKRGVKAHIRHSHPTEHRNSLTESIVVAESVPTQVKSATSPTTSKMREQLITALSKIEEKLTQLNQQRNDEQFRCVVEELQHTLANATEFIPGPIHPATKFYKMRKNKNAFTNVQEKYEHQTNPIRKSQRTAERRAEEYQSDLMQHLFYYQRKKCGNKIIKMGKSKSCTISVKDVEDTCRQRWECENTYEYIPPSLKKQELSSFIKNLHAATIGRKP